MGKDSTTMSLNDLSNLYQHYSPAPSDLERCSNFMCQPLQVKDKIFASDETLECEVGSASGEGNCTTRRMVESIRVGERKPLGSLINYSESNRSRGEGEVKEMISKESSSDQLIHFSNNMYVTSFNTFFLA